MPAFNKLLLLTVIFAGLGACTMGENYKKPELKFNKEWSTLSENQGTIFTYAQTEIDGSGARDINDAVWWKKFDDPVLEGLIDKALAGNNDLKIVQSRIDESLANERLSRSILFPQISATGSANRAKSRGAVGNNINSVSQGGISGSWDIDLFGSSRRRNEAATAQLGAAQADRNQARLNLIAEIARNYVRLRSIQQQYDITKRNLDMQRETLVITKGQRKEGAISDLDVVRAQAQVSTTEARLPQIKSALNTLLNRINILTGVQPGTLNDILSETDAVPVIAPDLVVVTPVKAISTRPDVKASEFRLAQATALSAAAIADFYPKLSLEGFFGVQNSGIYGNSTPWSTTATSLLPLLNFGKLTSQSSAADARAEQALYSYKQTVLVALEEVENGLSDYLNELNRYTSLTAVARQQAKAALIAREQYKAGVAAQIDLLVAERNRLDTENDVVISKQATAENLINLYRALGEGEEMLNMMDAQEEKKAAEKKE